VSKIALLLRSRLVKDILSSALAEAGFTVFAEPRLHDNETITIVDFYDYKYLETLNAHQQHGKKIVILTSDADSRRLSPDDIALLSGILTDDLSVAAFARSLRLIYSGERVFPPNLALGRGQQAPLARIIHEVG
jgi:DNA-binding NarL/FixJ family response regulator